jgi:hypothetical protein
MREISIHLISQTHGRGHVLIWKANLSQSLNPDAPTSPASTLSICTGQKTKECKRDFLHLVNISTSNQISDISPPIKTQISLLMFQLGKRAVKLVASDA